MNTPQICMFLASNFYGRAPKFLSLDYKVHPDTDYVAKFHHDRPRELGDPMAK